MSEYYTKARVGASGMFQTQQHGSAAAAHTAQKKHASASSSPHQLQGSTNTSSLHTPRKQQQSKLKHCARASRSNAQQTGSASATILTSSSTKPHLNQSSSGATISVTTPASQVMKGRTKLAREYYMMQAFVQQASKMTLGSQGSNSMSITYYSPEKSQASAKKNGQLNPSQQAGRRRNNAQTISQSTTAKILTDAAQQSYYKIVGSATFSKQPLSHNRSVGSPNTSSKATKQFSARTPPSHQENLISISTSSYQQQNVGPQRSHLHQITSKTKQQQQSNSAGKLNEAPSASSIQSAARMHHNSVVSPSLSSKQTAPRQSLLVQPRSHDSAASAKKSNDSKMTMLRGNLLSADNVVTLSPCNTASGKKKRDQMWPVSTSRTGSKNHLKQPEGTAPALSSLQVKPSAKARITNTYQKSHQMSVTKVASPTNNTLLNSMNVRNRMEQPRSASRDGSPADLQKVARKNLLTYAASQKLNIKRTTKADVQQHAAGSQSQVASAQSKRSKSKGKTKSNSNVGSGTAGTTTKQKSAKPLMSERLSNQTGSAQTITLTNKQLTQQPQNSSVKRNIVFELAGKPPLAMSHQSASSMINTSGMTPGSRNSLPSDTQPNSTTTAKHQKEKEPSAASAAGKHSQQLRVTNSKKHLQSSLRHQPQQIYAQTANSSQVQKPPSMTMSVASGKLTSGGPGNSQKPFVSQLICSEVAGALRFRNRSSDKIELRSTNNHNRDSNEAQQTQVSKTNFSSAAGGWHQQSCNESSGFYPSSFREAVISVTDQKRKENQISAVTKRKKSTKRGKSVKRMQATQQTERNTREKSPSTRIYLHPSTCERQQSPQQQNQTVRQRGVRPKKSGREQHPRDITHQIENAGVVGNFANGFQSQERGEQQQFVPVQVELLANDSKKLGPEYLQAMTTSNSICQQSAVLSKDAKILRVQLHKPKQVIGKNSRKLTTKKTTQTERKKYSSDVNAGTTYKVDLLKASILTDNRLQKQSFQAQQHSNQKEKQHELRTPSQTSGVSGSVHASTCNQIAGVGAGLLKKSAFVAKPRSNSSDEHLRIVQEDDQHQHQKELNQKQDKSISTMMKKKNCAVGIDLNELQQVKGTGSDESPRFILSLKQIEGLLLSQQQICEKRQVADELKQMEPLNKEVNQNGQTHYAKSAKVLSDLQEHQDDIQKPFQTAQNVKGLRQETAPYKNAQIQKSLKFIQASQQLLQQQHRQSNSTSDAEKSQSIGSKLNPGASFTAAVVYAPQLTKKQQPSSMTMKSSRTTISKRQQTNLVSLIHMQKSRAQHLQKMQQEFELQQREDGDEQGDDESQLEHLSPPEEQVRQMQSWPNEQCARSEEGQDGYSEDDHGTGVNEEEEEHEAEDDDEDKAQSENEEVLEEAGREREEYLVRDESEGPEESGAVVGASFQEASGADGQVSHSEYEIGHHHHVYHENADFLQSSQDNAMGQMHLQPAVNNEIEISDEQFTPIQHLSSHNSPVSESIDEFQSPERDQVQRNDEIMTIEVQQCSSMMIRDEEEQNPSSKRISEYISSPFSPHQEVPAYQSTQESRGQVPNERPIEASQFIAGQSLESQIRQVKSLASNETSHEKQVEFVEEDSAKVLDSLIYGKKKFDAPSFKSSINVSQSQNFNQSSTVKIQNQQKASSGDNVDGGLHNTVGDISTYKPDSLEDSEAISPTMVQIQLQLREQELSVVNNAVSNDNSTSINQNNSSSYLDRVKESSVSKKAKHVALTVATEPRVDEGPGHVALGHSNMLISEEEKDEVSICSLKQPSLRQITSSNKSSSQKRLNCQESTDHKKSIQDPNASITLSRLLLETSMQQSDRAMTTCMQAKEQFKKLHDNMKKVESESIQAYSTAQVNKHSSRHLTSTITPIENNFNEARLSRTIGDDVRDVLSVERHPSTPMDKVIRYGDEFEQATPQPGHDRNYEEQKPHEKHPSVVRKSSCGESISQDKRKQKNYMVDEVWPLAAGKSVNQSLHHQRTSSVTSLTHSQGSRTLEQLKQAQSKNLDSKQQPQLQSQSSCRSIHVSPRNGDPVQLTQEHMNQLIQQHQQQSLYSPISQMTQFRFDMDTDDRLCKNSCSDNGNQHQLAKSLSGQSEKIAVEPWKSQTMNQARNHDGVDRIQTLLTQSEEAGHEPAKLVQMILQMQQRSGNLAHICHDNRMLQVEDQAANDDLSSSKPTGSLGTEEPTISLRVSQKQAENKVITEQDEEAMAVSRGTSSPEKRSLQRLRFPIEYEAQETKSIINDGDQDESPDRRVNNNSQYEEAPFEKSQLDENDGLNLILFQGREDLLECGRIGRLDELSRAANQEHHLSSIRSHHGPTNRVSMEQKLAANTLHSNSKNDSRIQVLTPKRPQYDVITPTPAHYRALPANHMDTVSNPTSCSQLAAIEDVLLSMSPPGTKHYTNINSNNLDCVASLMSADSDQIMRGVILEPNSAVGRKPLTQTKSMPVNGHPTLQKNLKRELCKSNFKTSMALDEILQQSKETTSHDEQFSVENVDENCKLENALDQKIDLDQMRSPVTESVLDFEEIKVASNCTERQTPENALLCSAMNGEKGTYSEKRACAVSRAADSSAHSIIPPGTPTTHTLDFEEAVNTIDSPAPIAQTLPIEAMQKHPLPVQNPIKELATSTGSGSGYAPRLFDIDSLNAIKKANDLASKKVEITNQIFDMLVREISEDLFPARSDQGKKSKRRKRHRTKKLSVQPKIKELVDGVPRDMCLRRIQIQAKIRQSMATSVECSLSATQSASTISRENTKLMSSFNEITKSKEMLNEASCQFHRIEHRKQEQNELLSKLVSAISNEQTRSTKKRPRGQPALRGIKTTSDVLIGYLNTLFESLLEDEASFLESLATPFQLNTLQELKNLQVLALQSKQSQGQGNKYGKRRLLSDKRSSSPSPYGSNNVVIMTNAERNGCSSMDEDLEVALYGQHHNQQPVLSVEIYLDIERQKEFVLLADSLSDANLYDDEEELEEESDDEVEEDRPEDKTADEYSESKTQVAKKPVTVRRKQTMKECLEENQSMLAEWENIHNKVLFDAVNDALDDYRPYGQRGPPAPWSGQTRALTYRYSQNAKEVLDHVRDKVINLSKTFGGALANSELLKEYHIRGPLEEDKLMMLREERLAIMMMQDVEETQYKWDDLERQESGIKIDLAEMILDQLAAEIASELSEISSLR